MPPPERERYRVTVPASTSNLGPGFDLLGLALDLALEVTVTVERSAPSAASGVSVHCADGARHWPSSNDLLALAFERARAAFGAAAGAAALDVRSAIPIARGLGSSGAAVVAGLLLGAQLAPRPVTREELLRLAIELEGHPDNVTPALHGGLCLSVVPPGGAPRVVRIEPHPDLHFAVAWPEARLTTAAARALLPDSVPFADAAENARRLALLLEGLRSGDPELLTLGGEDRLHVPYRLPHVPAGAAALGAARAAGAWLATLSGSGTALFAIAPADRVRAVADAMQAELAGPGGGATGRVVEVVREAPTPIAL